MQGFGCLLNRKNCRNITAYNSGTHLRSSFFWPASYNNSPSHFSYRFASLVANASVSSRNYKRPLGRNLWSWKWHCSSHSAWIRKLPASSGRFALGWRVEIFVAECLVQFQSLIPVKLDTRNSDKAVTIAWTPRRVSARFLGHGTWARDEKRLRVQAATFTWNVSASNFMYAAT